LYTAIAVIVIVDTSAMMMASVVILSRYILSPIRIC
jgi:hypothetical protein